jgi:hypothetical protein
VPCPRRKVIACKAERGPNKRRRAAPLRGRPKLVRVVSWLARACLTCPRGTCPGKSFFPGHACPRIRLWGGDAGFSGFLFPFFNAASLPCESCGACVFTSRRVARYTAICHHHAELVSRRLIARQASQMRLSHVALLAVYGVPSCFSSQLVVVLSRHTPEALETTLIGPGTANDR